MSLPPGHLPGWGFARMCWEAAQVAAYGHVVSPSFGPFPREMSPPSAASRAYYELIDRASFYRALARFMPAGHCLWVVL